MNGLNKISLAEYFRGHDIDLFEGIMLIEVAVKRAVRSGSQISAVNEEGEIKFYAITADSEYRPIKFKQAVLDSITSHLANIVQNYQLSKAVEQAQSQVDQKEVIRGVISSKTPSGYFVNIGASFAFMPIKESVKTEAVKNLYNVGSPLSFAIIDVGFDRSGIPKILLSRRSSFLSLTIARSIFAKYNFVRIKRKAGIKQTILLRAFPQKEDQVKYRAHFPTEKINYQKLNYDGSIKIATRKRS
jgi:hypothetical protein